MILYARLNGYKMNVGGIIEGSIKEYHLSNKRGLIPHPATITRLCILAGVKGVWGGRGTMSLGFTSDPYRDYQGAKEQKA